MHGPFTHNKGQLSAISRVYRLTDYWCLGKGKASTMTKSLNHWNSTRMLHWTPSYNE